MTGSAPPDWLSRAVLELVPAGPVEGTLDAPSSKSLTNRLLVIAALAEGKSVLSRLLESDDTVAMTSGLRALGARIEDVGGDTEVTGTSGRPVAGGTEVNAGLSGTTLRFLAAVALLAKGTVVLDGSRAPAPASDRSAPRRVGCGWGRRLERRRQAAVADLEPWPCRRPAQSRCLGQLTVRHGASPRRPVCRR